MTAAHGDRGGAGWGDGGRGTGRRDDRDRDDNGDDEMNGQQDAVTEIVNGVAKFLALNKFAQEVQKQIIRWGAELKAEADGKERDPEQAPLDDPSFAAMFFVKSAFLELMDAIPPDLARKPDESEVHP